MEVVRLLKKRPWGILGALILLAMIAIAILAPVITPFQPNQIDLRNILQPPGGEFILGNDNLGRDIFTILVYGARPYVTAGLIATGMALVLGLLLGIISASIGGRTDKILRWAVLVPPMLLGLVLLFFILHYLVRVWLPFPLFVIPAAMALSGFMAIYVSLFISLVFLPAFYNMVRAALLSASLGNRSGASPGNTSGSVTFSRGLIPLIPLTLVTLGVAIGLAVSIISWAGYYGFGMPPGIPEWGSALSSGGRAYLETAPWTARYYVIAILVTFAGTILFMQATYEIWFPRISRSA